MLLTINEYAERSDISTEAVRRRIRYGEILPCFKRGELRLYIDTEDFPIKGRQKAGRPKGSRNKCAKK